MQAKTVHIVDDDALVRGATSFLLISHGYSPRIYESGSEFLRQADRDEGCVLLDLRMSEMSGLQVLEALKQGGSSAPVIMLTGHGDIAIAVRALKLGAVDFIQKPYEDGVLVAAIERALAGGGADSRRKKSKRAAIERLERLSRRETQVLRGLLGGMTNKETARLLDLSPRTVEMHRASMMVDLGVDAAADAIRIAIAGELTPLDQPEAVAEPPRPAVDASTDCAVLLDERFDITFLNRETVAIVGLERDLVGTNFWKAFPRTRQTDAFKRLKCAAEGAAEPCFDFYCPDLCRWLAVKAGPIPGGLQLDFRDPTAQRDAVRQTDTGLQLALEIGGAAPRP